MDKKYSCGHLMGKLQEESVREWIEGDFELSTPCPECLRVENSSETVLAEIEKNPKKLYCFYVFINQKFFMYTLHKQKNPPKNVKLCMDFPGCNVYRIVVDY